MIFHIIRKKVKFIFYKYTYISIKNNDFERTIKMVENKRNEFLSILSSNSENDLQDYLLSYGKSPKAICPIMFVDKESTTEEVESTN